METIFDYLPGASVSLDHQVEGAVAARLELIADHYAERRAPARAGEPIYRPIPPGMLYLDREGFDAALAKGPCFEITPFAKPDGGAQGVDIGGRPGPILTGQPLAAFNGFAELKTKWTASGRTIILAAWQPRAPDVDAERARHP
jgi:transcription-repair coupling factor (superfamily II helicase)